MSLVSKLGMVTATPSSFAQPDSRGRLSPHKTWLSVLGQLPRDDLESSTQHDIDRLAVSHVFLLEDACRECVFIVVIKHRHRFLHNDGPVIKFLIHEMHGATGYFHPICERLLLRLQSRKRRQQGRMDV